MHEFCQWETMKARCRWNSEVIVMTSARWGRMNTGRCLDIHPKLMASNSDDPMFLGCSEDVLSLLDTKCSSKPACDVVVPNPDLDQVTPCYEDLTRYLEASYTCVKGISLNIITGPPNGPVLFCSLASVGVCRLSSSVTLPASARAGRSPGAWAVGRPTLHAGPVVLRPVRATL